MEHAKKDFRTELGKAQGLGSARSGTAHFARQRLTALVSAPLLIGFIALVISLGGKDYAQIHALFARPPVALFMALMLLFGIYHMKLGMQVIIEDYIHGHLLRFAALALNIFFCAALAAGAVLALVKIMLGV